jgi:hypothetical protein
MHPLLSRFSSVTFYSGAVSDGTDPAPLPYNWPAGTPLLFVDVPGREGSAGQSRVNKAEARVVAGVVARLCGGEGLGWGEGREGGKGRGGGEGQERGGEGEGREGGGGRGGREGGSGGGGSHGRRAAGARRGKPSTTEASEQRIPEGGKTEGEEEIPEGGAVGVISPYAGQVALLRKMLAPQIRRGMVEVR